MPGFGKIIAYALFYLCRYSFVTVVAVLFFLSLTGGFFAGTRTGRGSSREEGNHDAASTVSPSAVPSRVVAPVSLREACQTEMRLYCRDHPSSPLRCVVEQYDRIARANGEEPNQQTSALYSDACGSWLAARGSCLNFVRARGRELCGDAVHNSRECLRRIPPLVLPHICVTSGYYESVRLIGKLRQHRTADDRLRVLYGTLPKRENAEQSEAD